MDKEDAAKKLRQKGYDAFVEKGVVCIRRKKTGNNRILFNCFKADAESIGYNASIGFLPYIDGGEEANNA